jgi:flagellar motor switch protein FliN/FliY
VNQEEIDAIMKGAIGNSPPKDAEFQMEDTQESEEAAKHVIKEEPSIRPENVFSQQINGTNIEILLDIPLEVSVELGRTKIVIKDLIQLGPGSIIELDKLIGEPVDLLVNDKLIARGEVVVFDENFGIRITDIATPAERLKSLR